MKESMLNKRRIGSREERRVRRRGDLRDPFEQLDVLRSLSELHSRR